MRKIAAALVMVTLVGCAGLSKSMLKTARSKQNDGEIVTQDVDTLRMATEKILQTKGYRISSKNFSEGPGGGGIRVTAVKEQAADLKNVGTGVATNMALGLLGGGNQSQKIKASSGEVIDFWLTKKWDEQTWETWEQGKYIVRVGGTKFDKDTKGVYYNKQSINEMDLRALETEVIDLAKGVKK